MDEINKSKLKLRYKQEVILDQTLAVHKNITQDW